ncbi:Receptor-like protein kinase [Stylosanthes scabra]|uniref:Receptor-like protein kinase n=1 Tax=Stylosanthes scabra TaxID=79078 RepID=A0ABU6U7J5_9FABA|nr:Receptor-like protein kinase [Stylosanthes scabra]
MEATDNLNERFVIGRGAHGVVYKALVAPNKAFAVKKLGFGASTSQKLSLEREIKTLGRIRHRNLLKVEDFWLRKDFGLILYRYMPNGSLHDVLHEKNPRACLEWMVRYKIALGISHGLAYLHHDCDPPIVHRDIKPKNILLDSDMEPHIADFGMAKLLEESESESSSLALGTIGYIAPESAYATTASRESDVYSFGVVLLELITRKKAADDGDLVAWVGSLWRETAEIGHIVDSELAQEFIDTQVMEQVTKVLMVALRCTQQDPHSRLPMTLVTNLLSDANPSKTNTNTKG